jgi:U2 small nuclear ribonucleoprotein B''
MAETSDHATDAMQGVISDATAPDSAAPEEEPEYVSETLYIQNLNEKIKIDGA